MRATRHHTVQVEGVRVEPLKLALWICAMEAGLGSPSTAIAHGILQPVASEQTVQLQPLGTILANFNG